MMETELTTPIFDAQGRHIGYRLTEAGQQVLESPAPLPIYEPDDMQRPFLDDPEEEFDEEDEEEDDYWDDDDLDDDLTPGV